MNFTQETVFPDYLLRKNQEANEENLKLFNAVVAMSKTGVEMALAKGGKPNYFHRPEDQKNSLHVACEEGYTEIVGCLLKAGAVVDAIAATSKATGLILASSNGHVDVIKMLLEAGANVNAVNGYGNTPLHEAARSSLEAVQALLSRENLANINVNARNNKGSTALHFACYEEEEMENVCPMIELLVASGADVNAADNQGVTPLLVLCTTGHLDAIKLLQSKGADMTAKDSFNRDMAATAAFYKHKSVEKFVKPKEEPSPGQTTTAPNSNRASSAGRRDTKSGTSATSGPRAGAGRGTAGTSGTGRAIRRDGSSTTGRQDRSRPTASAAGGRGAGSGSRRSVSPRSRNSRTAPSPSRGNQSSAGSITKKSG